MQDIGKKIKEIRKRKRLSQEELAEAAKVNLRTIQRIENNENEPRGTTLNLICNVLEVNAEDLYECGKEIDSNYIIFIHLSVITFLFFPLGNVILPLILWLNKKNKIIGVNETGANVLNFQIIWTVLLFMTSAGYIYSLVNHYAIRHFLLYFFLFLYLSNMVLPIAFAIKARKEKYPKYPVPIKLIK